VSSAQVCDTSAELQNHHTANHEGTGDDVPVFSQKQECIPAAVGDPSQEHPCRQRHGGADSKAAQVHENQVTGAPDINAHA